MIMMTKAEESAAPRWHADTAMGRVLIVVSANTRQQAYDRAVKHPHVAVWARLHGIYLHKFS